MINVILYNGFLEVISSCIIVRGVVFRATRHCLT